MLRVSSIAELRAVTARWRAAGDVLALVPTMGNLHQGHHSLIQRAAELGDRVIATIFVNPTQFGVGEDFGAYPRTLDRDAAELETQGCDLLFHPTVDEVYPLGLENSVSIEVPQLADILCGVFRPGHFSGVATVVTKLLNMVQPDIAVFGQKDYQQLMVIRRVVADLQVPVRIEPAPTVREASGLAMSSRNQYLTADQRIQAAEIHRTLQWMQAAVRGSADWRAVEASALDRLDSAGFRTDYAAIRRAENLAEPLPGQVSDLVALIATRLGKARLIDNLLI